MFLLWVYLFWAIVGIIAGVFCALLDEGERMDYDSRVKIQFLSIIISYVVGVAIFGHEPDGGSWFLTLVVQVACTEITYRLLKPFRLMR